MTQQLLDLYLNRYARGDQSVTGKLCSQLAEKMLFVPVVEQRNSAQVTKVSVLTLSDGRGSTIPVFTSEDSLKEWCRQEGYSDDALTLIAADFCSALKPQSTLLLDPGQRHSVVLTPELVDGIVHAEPAQFDDVDMEPNSEVITKRKDDDRPTAVPLQRAVQPQAPFVPNAVPVTPHPSHFEEWPEEGTVSVSRFEGAATPAPGQAVPGQPADAPVLVAPPPKAKPVAQQLDSTNAHTMVGKGPGMQSGPNGVRREPRAQHTVVMERPMIEHRGGTAGQPAADGVQPGGRPRTYTSSNLRKVIMSGATPEAGNPNGSPVQERPAPPSDDGGKKKSFLSFLKSGKN